MKHRRLSSNENKDFTGLFEPVNLHERLVLGLVCLAAICGLAILLNAYTQPSTAESVGESKRPRVPMHQVRAVEAGTKVASSTDLMNTAESTAEVTMHGTSSLAASATVQSNIPDTLTQERDVRNVDPRGEAVHDAADGATKQKTEIVHTLQAALNPLGLLR